MRILLFGDSHFSINSTPLDERWFPPYVARMSAVNANKYLAEWDKKTNEAYRRFLCRAKELGPYDEIISLGDNTPGNNEKGMICKEAGEQWNVFFQALERNFPSTPKKFVWGGHETGYLHRRVKRIPWFKPERIIGVEKKTGLTKESFQTAFELVGPAWQKFKREGFTFVLLNSELIRASHESLDEETRNFAIQLAEDQTQFLSQSLAESDEVILLIHDPTQLRFLKNCILPYLFSGKIKLTLSGHLHLPLFGRIYAMQSFERMINLRVVPSTLGWMFPFGVIRPKSRFCILKTFSNGSMRLSYCY